MIVRDYVVSQFRAENDLPGFSVNLAGKRAEIEGTLLRDSARPKTEALPKPQFVTGRSVDPWNFGNPRDLAHKKMGP